MAGLDFLSKNAFAFLGISLILVAAIVVAFISIPKPNTQNPSLRGVERVLKINGTSTIVFEGSGCRCPADYQPVCGGDGKTYFNPCFALCIDVGFSNGQCAPNLSRSECSQTQSNVVGTATQGNACSENTRCTAGLACISGRCTSASSNLPTTGKQCGASTTDATGRVTWDPTACGIGLTCNHGTCTEFSQACEYT